MSLCRHVHEDCEKERPYYDHCEKWLVRGQHRKGDYGGGRKENDEYVLRFMASPHLHLMLINT